MSSPLHRRNSFVVSYLAIAIISFLGYAHANPSTEQLTIQEPPVLFVDPATNTASVHLRLINQSSQPINNISITIGPFISKTSKKDIGAKATFSGPSDTSAKPSYELASLAPETIQTIKIDIANLWEAGESEAALYNNGNEIGRLKALKYRPTFAVKLNSTANPNSPDNVDVRFQQGKDGEITLKNEDAMNYPVQWEMSIDGKTTSPETIILPPNSTKAITVNPPEEWFTGGFSGLFKDQTKDGTLTLRLKPELSIDYPLLPERSIPIKAQLRNWSPNGSLLWGCRLFSSYCS